MSPELRAELARLRNEAASGRAAVDRVMRDIAALEGGELCACPLGRTDGPSYRIAGDVTTSKLLVCLDCGRRMGAQS